MATSQYTRRPRIRKTKTLGRRPARRRTQRRLLPRLTLGGLALTLFVGYILVRSYPQQSIAAIAILATVGIVSVVRPRRLAGLFTRIDRLARRRPALPNHTVFQLATFERMRPDHFERAIAELSVRSSDVHSASVHGGANDRGRDVLVHLRDGRRILIQCKRYTGKNKVTSEDVQKVNGTWRDIHGCDLAVIVTTSGFTRSAIDTNFLLPTPIRLTDGTGLVSWANGGTPPWR